MFSPGAKIYPRASDGPSSKSGDIIPARPSRPTSTRFRPHGSIPESNTAPKGVIKLDNQVLSSAMSHKQQNFPKEGMTLQAIRRIRDIVLQINKDWSTSDVANNLIIPWTQVEKSSLSHYLRKHHMEIPHPVLGLTYHEAVREQANVFVSHAWKYIFVELVDAIELFASDQVDLGNGRDINNFYFWLDLCVNSQCEVHNVPFHWWCTTFQSAVGKIGHTCLVLSPWDAPISLTRAWCLWELLSTKNTGAKLTLQFSRDQLANYEETLIHNFDYIMKAFCQIDVKKSEASNQDDKKKIFDAVEQFEEGFHGVNILVNGAIRDWLLQSGRQALRRLEEMKNPPDKEQHEENKIMMRGNVARLLKDCGNFEEAESLLSFALSDCGSSLGPEHATTLCTLSTLSTLLTEQGKYAEAEVMCLKALEGLQVCSDTQLQNYLTTMGNLAALYSKQGKYAEAEEMYRKTLDETKLKLGPNEPSLYGLANNLATTLVERGKDEEARMHYEFALQGYEVSLGPEHPTTLGTTNNIASLLAKQNRLEEAEEMYCRTLAGQEKVLGLDHPDVLGTVNNLGRLASLRQRLPEAERFYLRALEGQQRVLGPDHPDTIYSRCNLSSVLLKACKYSEAEMHLKQALIDVQNSLGINHIRCNQIARNLAFCYKCQKKYEKALEMYLLEMDLSRQNLSENDPEVMRCALDLASVYCQLSKLDLAEPLYRLVLSNRLELYGPQHPDTARAAYFLGALLAHPKICRYAEANELLNVAYECLRVSLGDNHDETVHAKTLCLHSEEMSKEMNRKINGKAWCRN